MAQNLSIELGNLVVNESNWKPLNLFNNLTSHIPPSGNLQVSSWNSTLYDSNYTYLRYNHNISSLNQGQRTAAVDYYFRPDIFSYRASCTYPISGQYGFLNRLLFYLLMIFALVARRRTWLAAAALGTAMTYAASAAVHAFALLARYNYSQNSIDDVLLHPQNFKADELGDLDLQGIFPILVAGCIMLTPILNWSVEIREHARAIAVYWGLLMFSALVPTLYKVWQGVVPLFDYDQLVTCAVDVATNCTYESAYGNTNNFISSTYYNRCNCNDTCGAVSLPHAPFRKDQGLQAYLISDRTISLTNKDSVNYIYALNILFLCFIAGHGILGLLEVNFTQAELRNKMMLLLAGKIAYADRVDWASKTRYGLAKFMASSFFAGAIVAAVICPAVFISSVIINEISTFGYPVSERSDAVGQWSTYVGAAFVLIGAVIQRYHLAWRHSVVLGLSKTWKIIRWTFRGGKGDFPLGPGKETRTKNNSMLRNIQDFLLQCARPFLHAGRSVLRSWHRVQEEWVDFKMWWRDPIDRSSQPHYRRPQKTTYGLLPLEGGAQIKRAATTPLTSPALSTQHFKQPTATTSPLVAGQSSPAIPPSSRLASPKPVDSGSPGFFDDPEHGQNTVQRPTFERRGTGA